MHLLPELNTLSSKLLRNVLQNREFENWCRLPYKGKGVCLFQECPQVNSKFHKMEGISSRE